MKIVRGIDCFSWANHLTRVITVDWGDNTEAIGREKVCHLHRHHRLRHRGIDRIYSVWPPLHETVVVPVFARNLLVAVVGVDVVVDDVVVDVVDDVAVVAVDVVDVVVDVVVGVVVVVDVVGYSYQQNGDCVRV